MIPPDLKDMTLPEMESWALEMGFKPYRGRQIFHWVFGKDTASIQEVTELPQETRDDLEGKVRIGRIEEVKRQRSIDGTEKYLFGLEDGHKIESVLIPDEDRLTLCISSQVGCGMDCNFCLTAVGGLARNLRPSEIVNQVSFIKRRLPEETPLTNIVVMGMGEPLANLANLIKAVRILTHPQGLNISGRRITVSTVGLVPQIRRLGESNLGVNLAVSLNASNDEIRTRIMPINQTYPLKDLLRACREYPLPPRRRIYFEYVLLSGVNDSPDDARRLAEIVQGIRCKINLIPFNEYPGAAYKRPSDEAVLHFQNILLERNYSAFIRKSRGRDILAACGQLREEG
jgi:23S rRNA (adenine2503-C2)-methyltransferase